MTSRILLLGKNGQVGWELQRTLMPLGEVVSTDYPEIDLANSDSIRNLIRELRPQVIVNAAAYTAVDKAESEPELAFAINGTAPGVLADEAHAIGAVLIHYSTDYVFDGQKGGLYVETDMPNPINVYGKSKLSGEQAVQAVDGAYLILRTSWVYSLRQKSFVTQVLRWAREQKVMRVVTDQVASPTWCRMLAEVTTQILAKGDDDVTGWMQKRKGLYHLAGKGSASRYEWAQSILAHDTFKEQQIVEQMLPAQTFEYPDPARRPQFTALACEKIESTFAIRLPTWEEQLPLALQQT